MLGLLPESCSQQSKTLRGTLRNTVVVRQRLYISQLKFEDRLDSMQAEGTADRSHKS